MKRRTLAICAVIAAFGTLTPACKDDEKASPEPGTAKPASAEPATAEPKELRLPGVDTSALTSRERKEWSGYVTELLAPCPETPVPLSQCILEKRACGKCVTAAKFVARLVRDGTAADAVRRLYDLRYDAKAVKNFPVDGSPTQGPEGAPVTIVEFADFECPACAGSVPLLDKTIAELKDKVRLAYKFVALTMHKHAEQAARAAIAAWNQGKFWEMHHKLFEVTAEATANHQSPAFEQRDLEAYAKGLGLDMGRFIADMKAQATTDRFEKDMKTFEEYAKVVVARGDDAHTPTLLVNGREYDPRFHVELEDWIKEEISEATGQPTAPAAKPDAGASPATSSSAQTDAGAKSAPPLAPKGK